MVWEAPTHCKAKEPKGDNMLVLSRKKDEAIIVRIPGQEDIRLTVVRIDNMNKVRIGVDADKDVVILRAELDEKEILGTK
jgi:carbon storage regulator CsrA